MVVMTAKLSRKKLLIAAAAVGLIVVLAFCLRGPGQDPEDADPQSDARASFLSSFGYTVGETPVQVQTVRVPSEPSEVFDRYYELQKSQGYDLSALSGKNITRYVYKLDGCGEGEWYATVLEYRGQIVGGDVASSTPGGQMHGFARPA